MVALQNRQNKGVPCKIVQDKELRAVLASTGSFRLTIGALNEPSKTPPGTSQFHSLTENRGRVTHFPPEMPTGWNMA